MILNAHKKQLIHDFVQDIHKTMTLWATYGDGPDNKIAKQNDYYDGRRKDWNSKWAADQQKVFNAIDSNWKLPGVGPLIYEPIEQLSTSAISLKLQAHNWGITLRLAGRDALFLSSAIVAFEDLQHPIVQHACARWEHWKNNNVVLCDQSGKILTLSMI